MFNNDRVTAVVGQPEHCMSLNSAWPFSDPAICEARQLTLILPTALTLYIFHDSWQIFVTDSFSSTKNSTIPHLLTNPLHMHQNCSTLHQQQAKHSKLTPNKKMQTLCVDLDFRTSHKTFWAALVCISSNKVSAIFVQFSTHLNALKLISV